MKAFHEEGLIVFLLVRWWKVGMLVGWLVWVLVLVDGGGCKNCPHSRKDVSKYSITFYIQRPGLITGNSRNARNAKNH